MSGDAVLIDTADCSISKLVHAADTLFARSGFGSAALVGGLAVTIRLATVHRATNDIDTVVDDPGTREWSLEYLGDQDGGSNRIVIDGVTIDILPTTRLPADADELPDADVDRLFVLGHRWALETATAVTVRVVGTTGTRSETSGAITVATVSALVACKLHAISDRRGAQQVKRESDALDLARLVADLVRQPQNAEPFGNAPFDLTALVADQIQRWFIDGSLRMARLINQGGPSGDRVEPADIAVLGGVALELLAR